MFSHRETDEVDYLHLVETEGIVESAPATAVDAETQDWMSIKSRGKREWEKDWEFSSYLFPSYDYDLTGCPINMAK